jgi:hypothetical protein
LTPPVQIASQCEEEANNEDYFDVMIVKNGAEETNAAYFGFEDIVNYFCIISIAVVAFKSV